MAATPNCQAVEAAVLASFPDAQFGRYNCRHIGSNPLRSWSQHAGSEPARKYYGNALDITHRDFGYTVYAVHTAWLKQVYGFLKPIAIVDQLLGPGDAGHSNHIHVSTWPKMKANFWYKPPCEDGKLVVINEDGTTGDTFGDPPPPKLEDDMNYRNILDRITEPEVEKLRVAGRWSGETVYYFDGRSNAVPGDGPGTNQHLVEILIASDQVASLEGGGSHDHIVRASVTSTN